MKLILYKNWEYIYSELLVDNGLKEFSRICYCECDAIVLSPLYLLFACVILVFCI